MGVDCGLPRLCGSHSAGGDERLSGSGHAPGWYGPARRVGALTVKGAVYFKNFVYRHWEFRESLKTHVVPDDEKSAIRCNILDAIVHSPDLIR